MDLEVRKGRRLDCGRSFRQQLAGYSRVREPPGASEMVDQQHLDGVNRSCLAAEKRIGAATVQRYFLRPPTSSRRGHPPVCPNVLGDRTLAARKPPWGTVARSRDMMRS